MKKDEVMALVIKYNPGDMLMVCMTELMFDGRWRSGMMLITSVEDIFERAKKEHLPIIMEATIESEAGLKKLGKIFRRKQKIVY